MLTVSATDGDPSVSNQVAFTIEEGWFVYFTYHMANDVIKPVFVVSDKKVIFKPAYSATETS